jgi:hypothetical protein
MNFKRSIMAAFGFAALLTTECADGRATAYSPGNYPSIDEFHVAPYLPQDHLDRDPVLGSNSTSPVGTLLIVGLDSSQSMTPEEWAIQKEATAAAFRHPLVKDAIRCKTGPHAIAVAVVEFSDDAHTRIAWVDLRSESCSGEDQQFEAKIESFAKAIENLRRGQAGQTCTRALLDYSVELFQKSPWIPFENRVVDVSSDGKNSCSTGFEFAKYRLEAQGARINGLAIVNEERDVNEWMQRSLVSSLQLSSPDGVTNSGKGQVWVVAEAPRGQLVQKFNEYSLQEALVSKITQEISALFIPAGPG